MISYSICQVKPLERQLLNQSCLWLGKWISFFSAPNKFCKLVSETSQRFLNEFGKPKSSIARVPLSFKKHFLLFIVYYSSICVLNVGFIEMGQNTFPFKKNFPFKMIFRSIGLWVVALDPLFLHLYGFTMWLSKDSVFFLTKCIFLVSHNQAGFILGYNLHSFKSALLS